WRPSRRMRRPAPSCFEMAASPPPQHEGKEAPRATTAPPPPTPPHVASLRGRGADRARGRSRVLDRKSTRLNSSHLVISYPIFAPVPQISTLSLHDALPILWRPSRRMRRPAPSCFEMAASPPPQHEGKEAPRATTAPPPPTPPHVASLRGRGADRVRGRSRV